MAKDLHFRACWCGREQRRASPQEQGSSFLLTSLHAFPDGSIEGPRQDLGFLHWNADLESRASPDLAGSFVPLATPMQHEKRKGLRRAAGEKLLQYNASTRCLLHHSRHANALFENPLQPLNRTVSRILNSISGFETILPTRAVCMHSTCKPLLALSTLSTVPGPSPDL